jgi:hypothetical protein
MKTEIIQVLEETMEVSFFNLEVGKNFQFWLKTQGK